MLLSVDPGGSRKGHTGVVLLEVPEGAPVRLVNSWALPHGVAGVVDWFFEEKCLEDVDLVVMETFVNRNIAGVDLTPVKVEGCFLGLLEYLWGGPIVLQQAAGKNSAVPDAALERLGFTKDLFPGDHHQDRWEALRHGVRFLKNDSHIPTIEVAFPRR